MRSSGDDRDPRGAATEFRRDPVDAQRRRARVCGAEIADDAHPVVEAAGKHRRDQFVEQGFIAGFRIGFAGELGERQCALGQCLEDQHGGAGAADQRVDDRCGGIGAVSGEAGGAADRERFHAVEFSWAARSDRRTHCSCTAV